MTIFLLGTLLSLSATASSASMITSGSFSVAGTSFVTGPGGVTVPAGTCQPGVQCIFFQDTLTPAINDKIDIALVGLPNGDTPLAVAGNNAANVVNLMNPLDTVGGIFPAAPFMSFNNAGVTAVREIDFIPAGVNGAAGCSASPPAAAQVCTPVGLPFNLQNLSATSSTVAWRVQGITSDSTSTWTGTLTAQFNTLPYQTVLSDLAANGFVSNTFSGQITLTTREAGTLSLLFVGSGMIICAMLLRRLLRH
jgi:hypothetical protein